MDTLSTNIMYYAVMFFAAALVVIAFIRLIKDLREDAPIGKALLALAGVILGAALVIWASRDFKGNQVLVDIVGNWIIDFFTVPHGG